MLRSLVEPEWGHRKAKSITRRDVILLLDRLESRGAIATRNRLASTLSGLFGVALDRGIVEAHFRLESGAWERSRERTLTLGEVRSFWKGLEDADATPQVRAALRFALLTGQRRSEVAGTVRAEIDDAGDLWRLPADRTKNSRPNVIPLPALALQVVAEADAIRAEAQRDDEAPSPFLFPSTRRGKPIAGAALTRALNRNRATLGLANADGPAPTVHDMRRTFATLHGELGTPPEVLGALLNHTPQTMTARVYNLAETLEARRVAMERWWWLALVLVGKDTQARGMFGADVVPLEGTGTR